MWGHQSGIAAELGFGKSVHQILRVVGERAKQGEDVVEALDEIVDSEFHLPYAPHYTKERLREVAKRTSREYVAANREVMAAIEQVEPRVEFTQPRPWRFPGGWT